MLRPLVTKMAVTSAVLQTLQLIAILTIILNDKTKSTVKYLFSAAFNRRNFFFISVSRASKISITALITCKLIDSFE